MLSLHCNSPLALPQLHCYAATKHAQLCSHPVYESPKRTATAYSFASSSVVRAQERDSGDFELDPEEAKEALMKLDQQLQTLSKKQVSPPKIKASEVKLSGAEFREEPPEITGSFLAYLAVVLFIFSIFYNILFYTVIKPAVDGPDTAPAIDDQSEPTGLAFLEWLPPASVFRQK